MVMHKVDNQSLTIEIFKILEKKLLTCKHIGTRKWGNPSGFQHEEPVYELTSNRGTILASTIEWANASTGELNRCGIITTAPEKNINITLGQIFEINIPYFFSKAFNTRVYQDGNTLEIRNYGKFTIGRRGLKKQAFFDYLKQKGYENEINYDEENKEYIKVFEIENMDIPDEYFLERLIKLTYILKEYKDYFRAIYTKKE